MLAQRFPAPTVLTILLLTAACGLVTSKSDPNQLKKHVSDKPSFTLFKPESWKVRPESSADALRISVADPEGASLVEVYFADNQKSRFDSLKLLGNQARTLRSRYPDLTVSEVRTAKDRSRATATLAYTRDRVSFRGKLYLQTDPQQVSVRSYVAPASRLEAQRNLLLDILANVRLGNPASAPARPAAAPAPVPVRVQLVPRRAPDGSLSISLPSDWNFQGQGGRAIAAARAGNMGFIFTSFDVLPSNYGVQVPPNVIISPYRSPSSFIVTVFGKFKNRNVRVLSATKDTATMQECVSRMRKQCDAEDVTMSWVSPEGAACAGGFKLVNFRPGITGQWFSIVSGIWGPQGDLERYLPMLEQIANSFSINDQYARHYIQQGLARLRELQKQTQRSMQELNAAREQNQADWEARQARQDNMQSKWDDYRRGNSYWISEMEGGKVYATDPWGTQDTQTGDRVEGAPYNYVHFEGQNPRHPSENMREVSSYELQQYLGGR